jgi:hypothetical protein
MATVVKDLGAVTAYAYAVEQGYTGTEEEFAQLMASYADVAEDAAASAQAAAASEAAASASEQAAKSSETAAAGSASSASADAATASSAASTATQQAGIATSGAETATQKAADAAASAQDAASSETAAAGSAAAAATSETNAETAETAAQTAQAAAEAAAQSVGESAAQIAENKEDIADLKSATATLDIRVTGLERLISGMDIGAASQLVYEGFGPTSLPVGTAIETEIDDVAVAMNVMDHDYHTPVNANIPHTCTIAMRDCYENMQFDAPEGLIHVVNGLAAGEHFYLTLYKGQYGGGTAQDGVYGGTLGADQAIPAGGYLRHTTMGAYHSGGYTRDQIANGKWIAYDASFVQIGAQIATDMDDTSGTNFGTATASTYQGNSEHVNFTERNVYGCNRVDQSAWLQYANAEGVGWWQQKNEWDFPPANVATIKGLMTGLDPAMKAAMVPVRIRTALTNCDGGGYVDIETKVFPLSMTEIGFGANNGQYETSWGLDNTLKTVPLAFWEGATNEDRIKTLNGDARYWFLRGASPSVAYGVRRVNASGALGNDYAYIAYGLVAAWVIGNPVIQPA